MSGTIEVDSAPVLVEIETSPVVVEIEQQRVLVEAAGDAPVVSIESSPIVLEAGTVESLELVIETAVTVVEIATGVVTIGSEEGAMYLETRYDTVNGGITYIGKAAAGSDPADPVWQILRLTETGTDGVTEFADDNANFDNVWNDRASLTY